MSTLKYFIKETIGRLKGDQAEVLAARNAKKAESAIKGQLAALRAKEVDLEIKTGELNDKLGDAKFPSLPIADNQHYINNIKLAQDAYEKAVNETADVAESIEYFENLLETYEDGDLPVQGGN